MSASTFAISVFPTPASPSRKSGFCRRKLRKITVARLRSATYEWLWRAVSTSRIDEGRFTCTPFDAKVSEKGVVVPRGTSLPRGCLDLALHAAKELIHHHSRRWQEDALPNPGDHPANLTVARDGNLRPTLG